MIIHSSFKQTIIPVSPNFIDQSYPDITHNKINYVYINSYISIDDPIVDSLVEIVNSYISIDDLITDSLINNKLLLS